MKRWLLALLAAGATALAGFAYIHLAPAAAAASLVQVTNFGNNPSGLQMYIYVPDNLVPDRPSWSRCISAPARGRSSTRAPSSPRWPTSMGSSWSTRR